MNKYWLLIFLFISLTPFCQEKSIEEIYQECAYNSLSDKGKNIKRYTKEFEFFLIKKGVLKDNTSRSYYNLFKSFSEGKRYNSNEFEYAYSDSINKNIEDRLKLFPISIECIEEVKNYKNYFKFDNNYLNTNWNEKKNIREMIKENLHVISKKDFSLDYYKQRAFVLLYLLERF